MASAREWEALGVSDTGLIARYQPAPIRTPTPTHWDV